MSKKIVPLSPNEIEKLVATYPTPFHLYDEKGIRENARAFRKAFSWAKGWNNYFAVKACPNPSILSILKEEGFGADCSSEAELIMAQQVGFEGEEVMFTSNDTPKEEFALAYNM